MRTIILFMSTLSLLAAPVLELDFESKPDQLDSGVRSAQPGPRSPEYPSFGEDNKALVFQGNGAVLRIPDREDLRFAQGDSISIEAWVRLDSIDDDRNTYIIGKGRTLRKGYPDTNQNFALRLRGVRGTGNPSFLFRSAENWHRWTTTTGITASRVWHHVAVRYTFGKPETIAGFIDGQPVEGRWDMGGATKLAPVVDDDEIWVGGSMARSASSSFTGGIDDLRVHRQLISDADIATRYRRDAEFAPKPKVVTVPDGQVLVELCEGGSWDDSLEPVETYTEPAFGFFRYPLKYEATGVRGMRNPLLLRSHADITLPAGKHRILIRSRSGARLFVGDRMLVSLPFRKGYAGGHGGVRKNYLDLGPQVRWAAPGCGEKVVEWTSDGKPHRFRFDVVVGGGKGHNGHRPELGETMVAWSPVDAQHMTLLSPQRDIPLTDAGWTGYVAERNPVFDAIDAATRKALLEPHLPTWRTRHDKARAVIASRPALPHASIDGFIDAKLAAAATPVEHSPTEQYFVDKVQPILDEHCHRCHGKKDKGELKLDSREAALVGGESGHPAVVPGDIGKSLLIELVKAGEDERMPPKGDGLSVAEIAILEKWVADGAAWAEASRPPPKTTPIVNDLAYLRRITLDLAGTIPSPEEITDYLAAPAESRRAIAVDRLLDDRRWADAWVGYWQDVLAENPNLVKPSLNNSGPFRWWIYEAFLDNKPMDLVVTELIRMQGSLYDGGPRGFGMAAQNDVPMAAKAVILGSAFLGTQMKCARCHDAPYHDVMQEDLFSIAAMLERKPVAVPKSSSVPMDKIHDRRPLIQVTMKPGQEAKARWPFAEFAKPELSGAKDSREKLAELITAPENTRFAAVIANRTWQRYMGRGIVEPVDDFERGDISHPELLEFLARELVRSGYDLKHLARIILSSQAYQRQVAPEADRPELFAAPSRRRLAAEQVVDSLYQGAGIAMATEPITMDRDNRQKWQNFVNLGEPRRAWMFTSLSNERDRPSLGFPRAQAVIDVLAAFGWRASRQEPIAARASEANVLQPAILANGTFGGWMTRLSDQHAVTDLCLEDQPLTQLIDRVYWRLLTRPPTDAERARYLSLLEPGYAERVLQRQRPDPPRPSPTYVTWSNHLNTEANSIALRLEKEARAAYPSTSRLEPVWRDRAEDMVWTILNSPEMVHYP